MVGHILRRLAIVLVLLVMVLGFLAVRFIVEGGMFKSAAPHFAGTCSSVDLGGETVRDLAVDRGSGTVYLAMGTAIKRLDLSGAAPALTSVLSMAPADFAPEALTLFAEGEFKQMFVVNRPRGERHTVELFEPTPDSGMWTHAASLRDTRFRDPADVAAVGPAHFYLANRSAATNVFQRIGEMLLGQGQAITVYNDGQRTVNAVQDMAGAGGIAVSAEGETVFVAETLARQIRVYSREPFLGKLTPKDTIKVPGAPRRIDMATDGSLWVAADPRFSFAGPKSEAGAPSQVLRITDPAGERPGVTEIYREDAAKFAGVHAAVVVGDKLVMASAAENRLQVCTPK